MYIRILTFMAYGENNIMVHYIFFTSKLRGEKKSFMRLVHKGGSIEIKQTYKLNIRNTHN